MTLPTVHNTDHAANGMQRYFTCETHPWLLWSTMHTPDVGQTCPPDCAGPGMPIGLSLRMLEKLIGGDAS